MLMFATSPGNLSPALIFLRRPLTLTTVQVHAIFMQVRAAKSSAEDDVYQLNIADWPSTMVVERVHGKKRNVKPALHIYPMTTRNVSMNQDRGLNLSN